VSALREANRRLFDGPYGSVYSFYIERPCLARVGAAAIWGGDVRPTYELLRAVGELPDGSVVVDAPCGGGIGFRSLSPGQRVRYLAVDISPAQVERADASTAFRIPARRCAKLLAACVRAAA